MPLRWPFARLNDENRLRHPSRSQRGVNMATRRLPLAGRRIGVFGRGGSGKSTLTILTARALCHRGYPVVILDADSTNLGMPAVLGVEGEPESLTDLFGGLVFSGGRVTCPVDDPTLLEGHILRLDEIPDPFRALTPDGIVYLAGGKMGRLGAGAGCDGPVAKIARDLEVRVPEDPQPVMLVDFKAGMEDSVRGVITGLDWGLLVVDPSSTAIRLAGEMQRMVAAVRSGVRPATAHLCNPGLVTIAESLYRKARIRGLSVVLNRVRDPETEEILRTGLAEEGVRPAGRIGNYPEVERAWLRGEPLDSPDALEETAAFLDRVEAEMASASR